VPIVLGVQAEFPKTAGGRLVVARATVEHVVVHFVGLAIRRIRGRHAAIVWPCAAVHRIRQVSDYFDDLLQRLGSDLPKPPGDDVMAVAHHKVAAGNQIRQLAKKNDIMALVAAGSIADSRYEANRALGRKPNQRRTLPRNNTAYVISTVRRPEEVTTLRRIYWRRFLSCWSKRFAGSAGALPRRKGYCRRGCHKP
jgi:hypothetical protein